MHGRWTRRVVWEKNGVWRTDMFKSVLRDERLKEAEFVCKGGPTVLIQAEDLRSVLPKLHDHYNRQIWGPFDIDPIASTIENYKIGMTLK
jgi:hypothetical protein